MDYVSIDNWTLTFTDIYFDDPATDAEEGGNDTLSGGAGDDLISGDVGDDSITGGAGDDTFLYSVGDGADTITDFNAGNTGTLDDGNTANNDFIDLSGYYDNLSELYADQADDGILNQSNTLDGKGRATDYSDNTQFGPGSIFFNGASANNSFYTNENTGVVCFTSGTRIRTPGKTVLIDDLRIGDLVSTLDNGDQPIRWIGRRMIEAKSLISNANLRPVLIPKGTFGALRDLFISRQHAVLIDPYQLARAAHLAGIKGLPVRVVNAKAPVTYIHLMFDAHQIIFAEDVPCESFYPGKNAIEMLPPKSLHDLVCAFPEFENAATVEDFARLYGATARPLVKPKEIKVFAATST